MVKVGDAVKAGQLIGHVDPNARGLCAMGTIELHFLKQGERAQDAGQPDPRP